MKFHQDEQSGPFQRTNDSKLSDDRQVVIKKVSKYKSEPVRWLEEGRIALGKLTMIAGDPGLGKSFITLDMAARVTRGELPKSTGPLTDPGQVVLLNAEDDAGDTIRPRLEAMGADLTRVHMFEGVMAPMSRVCGLTQLDTDVQLLALAMKKIDNLRLVVIDPISAYMGKTDSHNNADVRSVLAELSRLAAWTGAAVVCVTHLNKDAGGKRAIYRAMGSLAFTAAARAVHLVTKHPDDPAKRIVAPVKNNLGIDMPPKVYRLEDGKVDWLDEEVEWDADGLENAPSTCTSMIDEAHAFLLEALGQGERPSTEIIQEANTQGIKEHNLQRARKVLSIRSVRRAKGWHWILDDTTSTPDETSERLYEQPSGEFASDGYV